MNEKQTKLEEQDHPLKNTDGAFVQVGKNGEPVMPTQKESERAQPQTERTTDKER